jgi:hypothetical protein
MGLCSVSFPIAFADEMVFELVHVQKAHLP